MVVFLFQFSLGCITNIAARKWIGLSYSPSQSGLPVVRQRKRVQLRQPRGTEKVAQGGQAVVVHVQLPEEDVV